VAQMIDPHSHQRPAMCLIAFHLEKSRHRLAA
jgi:hypothetical protein